MFVGWGVDWKFPLGSDLSAAAHPHTQAARGMLVPAPAISVCRDAERARIGFLMLCGLLWFMLVRDFVRSPSPCQALCWLCWRKDFSRASSAALPPAPLWLPQWALGLMRSSWSISRSRCSMHI